MNADTLALLAAVIQGFHRASANPLTDHEAVARAQQLWLETVRQLKQRVHGEATP